MTDPATLDVVLQAARNLCQYFRADVEIVGPETLVSDHTGSIVQIAHGLELADSILPTFPIKLDPNDGICIRDHAGRERLYRFTAGLGVAMLRPLPKARVELVLWGWDIAGLQYASRLLPLCTGAGQPDFVVSSKQCLCKGAASVLAMGFFDSSWLVSQDSYLT